MQEINHVLKSVLREIIGWGFFFLCSSANLLAKWYARLIKEHKREKEQYSPLQTEGADSAKHMRGVYFSNAIERFSLEWQKVIGFALS